MHELWVTLPPLIIVSAALPAQTLLTLLLVRSSTAAAFAWVSGMTVVRLFQGFLFGIVLSSSEDHSLVFNSPKFVLGTLLLVFSILLYVKALRELLGAEDEDALPPSWLAKVGSMSPLMAFAAGAVFMTVSVKYLVFTLGAISAIDEANVGPELSVVAFILFVLPAEILPLMILALAVSGSRQSSAILEGFGSWLRNNNRIITIIFGLVFGTWFLVKALKELEVF